MEEIANLDLVVAAWGACVALPEINRGVAAKTGFLPRLARTIGRPRATGLGKSITTEEAKDWELLISAKDDGPVDSAVMDRPVMKSTLEYAETIVRNSPDSVIISRAGIVAGREDGITENASRLLSESWQSGLNAGIKRM